MGIFFLLFLWLFCVSLLVRNIANITQARIVHTILSAFGLFLVLALRSPLCGIDLATSESGYYYSFSKISNLSFYNILLGENFLNYERGFVFYTKCVSLISDSPQFYLAFTAGIGLLLIGNIIYRYSSNIFISFLTYSCFGMYLFSFSGLRQHLAIAIFFFSFKYLYENKFFKFLLMVLLASTFHSSAIIGLIIWPFRNVQLNSTKLLLSLFLLFITIPLFNNIVSMIIELVFNEDRYSNYISSEGSAITMFLVYLLILVISYFMRPDIDDKLLNMIRCLIFGAVIIQSLGLISSGSMTRVGYYFQIYFSLFFPLIIERLGDRSRLLSSFIITVIMISFFIYMAKGGYLNVVPYKFFWETSL